MERITKFYESVNDYKFCVYKCGSHIALEVNDLGNKTNMLFDPFCIGVLIANFHNNPDNIENRLISNKDIYQFTLLHYENAKSYSLILKTDIKELYLHFHNFKEYEKFIKFIKMSYIEIWKECC